jgi:antitoxin HigA-1
MPPKRWTTSECLPATDWKHSAETGPDNTASASTSNGGSACEILMAEFLEPLQVSQNRLAVAIGVPPRRINEIVHGKRRVTADTALRLARYFGTTDRFWLNLQTRFDLEVEKDHLGNTLERIEPLKTAV